MSPVRPDYFNELPQVAVQHLVVRLLYTSIYQLREFGFFIQYCFGL